MNIDEAIGRLNYQIKMKDTDVYTPINYDAIETLINEYNNLKQIEEAHRIENGELRKELEQEKEKNNELFEEYNKRVNTIIKYEQGIKCFIDETNITDIEPWTTYKINGRLLFDLNELLEEE